MASIRRTESARPLTKPSVGSARGPKYERINHPIRKWPWRHKHIESTLKNPNFSFSRVDINLIVEDSAIEYIEKLLEEPLKRIAVELKHLSTRLQRTSKGEVHTALRLIFHDNLANMAIGSGVHAFSLFLMSMDRYRFSKSVRCLLSFSVGHFFRWLVDQHVSKRITDCSVVHLAAAFQTLTEELLTRTVQRKIAAENPKGKNKVVKTEYLHLEYTWPSDPAAYTPVTAAYQDEPPEGSASGDTSYDPTYAAPEDNSYTPLLSGADGGETSFNWPNTDCPEYAVQVVYRKPSLGGKKDFKLTAEVLKEVIQHDQDLSRVFGLESLDVEAVVQEEVEDPYNLDISEYYEDCGCEHCGDITNPLDLCCLHSMSSMRDLVSKQQQLLQHQLQTYRRANNPTTVSLSWSNNAFHTLLYYIGQHNDETGTCHKIPIKEWLRVSTIFATHHLSEMIDEDDVAQAARFLLGVDHPPRRYCHISPVNYSTLSNRPTETLPRDSNLEDPLSLSNKLSCAPHPLPLKLIMCGRHEPIRQALQAIGPDGINSVIFQGMTPLMCAASAGDLNLVQMLLDADAHPNIAVTIPSDNSQVVPMETRKWTALSFAVLHSHADIVKCLLNRGGAVEGSINNPVEIVTETPLQLAAAAGNMEIVTLLLEKGADPFLSSHGTVTSPRYRGGSNAIALAVAHGHTAVRHKLLQHQPSVKSNDMLSLQEILAEGYLFQNNRDHGLRLSRLRKLQEALYLACEHGYLDIALELKSIGVMWNLNFWTRCLETAYEEENNEVVWYLLADYDCMRVDEFSNAFCKDGLVLLFYIFREAKDLEITLAASKMLQHCYGVYQWKPVNSTYDHEPFDPTGPRIDLKYVNNKELSDVTFCVDKEMFYAHKIVLVTASERFNAMLSKHFVEGSSTVVQIPDIKYNIFEIIIKYLYAGSVNNLEIKGNLILDVLSAAHFFMLDDLQYHCETLASEYLTKENVIENFKKAKLFNANDLVFSCLHFFLGFLPELVVKDDFVVLLPDLYMPLQQHLAKRIQKRIKTRSMSVTNSPLLS